MERIKEQVVWMLILSRYGKPVTGGVFDTEKGALTAQKAVLDNKLPNDPVEVTVLKSRLRTRESAQARGKAILERRKPA